MKSNLNPNNLFYVVTRQANGWVVKTEDGDYYSYDHWGKLRKDIQRCEDVGSMRHLTRGTKVEV